MSVCMLGIGEALCSTQSQSSRVCFVPVVGAGALSDSAFVEEQEIWLLTLGGRGLNSAELVGQDASPAY